MSRSDRGQGGGDKINQGGKAILICPRCGRQAERLLPMPIPRKHKATPVQETVLCERCLRDLEKEYTREENETLPPE